MPGHGLCDSWFLGDVAIDFTDIPFIPVKRNPRSSLFVSLRTNRNEAGNSPWCLRVNEVGRRKRTSQRPSRIPVSTHMRKSIVFKRTHQQQQDMDKTYQDGNARGAGGRIRQLGMTGCAKRKIRTISEYRQARMLGGGVQKERHHLKVASDDGKHLGHPSGRQSQHLDCVVGGRCYWVS